MRWFVLLGVVAGAAAPTLHLKVGPAPLRVGAPVPIVVSGPFSSVRVQAVSPSGRVAPIAVRRAGRDRWRGVFRFGRTGRWRVQAIAGELKVRVSVLIRPALPTPPPEGFGPLGARGCAPPSPRNTDGEVFGTTVGGRFWALLGGDDTASLDGVVGKETKIVFKLSAGFPSTFYAVSPPGSRTKPVSGPTPHGSSSWDRYGTEWGAVFVFGQTGCWRIHAATSTTSGDIFVDVRS